MVSFFPFSFLLNLILSYSLTIPQHILEDPDAKEERRLKYLDQEKYDYIQNYLEQSREHAKDLDAHSVMEESDSGKPGSSSVPSEVGTEETSGKLTIYLYKPRKLSAKSWSQIAV